MKRYFITGTDTDCGKTYVTSQLLKHYSNAVALKPVASGCKRIGNELLNPDVQELIKDNQLPSDLINPWRFELAVSPHIAAEKEGKYINCMDLVRYCTEFNLPGKELLLIEGAGGLMVPLNKEHTWLDFLKRSQIPVLLVVGMKLGCINHALLTMHVLKTQGISCSGWIANCIDPNMLVLEENIDTLTQLIEAPLIGQIPYNGVLNFFTQVFNGR